MPIELTRHLTIYFQYLPNGEKVEGDTEKVKGEMISRWQMTCPLPETPVSRNASLSQAEASMYGFMVNMYLCF